ncbi:MAG: enoyl-CoA hydratase/isomerase family protein [Pseudomonadota bacterium]|nr:enoyl-CoA hydratase/isomerase family protein [Pseudomonadota bacterium]
MSKSQIDLSVENFVAVVTMNNTPVNAQGKQFHEDMTQIMDEISDRVDIRVAILTGAGKCFSAGADLRAKAERTGAPGEPSQHNRLARECFHSIVECRKPIIAAINGPALGAGLAVAASCDILVAANSASVGLPEINVGLLGGGRHAMRLFGHSKTRQMMLTGLRLDGAELYRLGVVEDCVPVSDLMDVAMALAKEIAAKSPPAVVLAKHALNAIENMSLRDGYRFEQTMTVKVGRTEDAAEATRSFLEKREPVFKER